MKNKHEGTIKNISIFTLILTMFFLNRFSVSAQIFVGATLCICAILIGIYCAYKGIKMGAALMFCFALAGFFGILSQYYDSYNLAVPVPTCIFLGLFLGYKTIVKSGDEEQIRKIKKMKTNGIIGTILYLIIQIVMIVTIFIKQW